jgi:methyltransferase-like protein 6
MEIESFDKATVFSINGPGEYVDGGILSNPDLLWIDDDWTEERINDAKLSLLKQSSNGVAPNAFWVQKYKNDANKYWHEFYKRNKTNFYKDRHYLHVVFPELASSPSNEDTKIIKLLEVGCGVGNAVIPLLDLNPQLDIVAIDFARSAIELLQAEILTLELDQPINNDLPSTNNSNNNSNPRRKGNISARVCDVTKDDLPVDENSVDLILCMFVISAIPPATIPHVFSKLFKALKPGGKLLFRDYGRYDEAQLRFTNKSKLDENFYVRQDGTCVYYFEDTELIKWLCGENATSNKSIVNDEITLNSNNTLVNNINSNGTLVNSINSNGTGIGFQCEECFYIKRQYANREQKKVRYRVWLHGKFVKPL